MKHTIHKWGVDISSIHEVIGPQHTPTYLNPNQKNENFHEKIKCLEQPKMQNKYQQNFVVGGATSREGGVKPVGTKSQVCQRKYFWGSPNNALQIFQKFKKKKNVFHNHNRRKAGSQDPRSRTFFGQNQEISSKIRKFHAKLGDFRQNQEI